MEILNRDKNKILKIGLTGGIGSGKSTVTSFLLEQNIKVIDADKISREVLNIYPEILDRISETFGPEFIDENGALKRKALGNFIFEESIRRKTLENIIIPFIKKEIFIRINEYYSIGEKICFVDAPTLIENNLHKDMDFNILVWTDLKTQINRVMRRDDLTLEETMNRINSQKPLDEKKVLVDYVIDNSSSIESTQKQALNILKHLGGGGCHIAAERFEEF